MNTGYHHINLSQEQINQLYNDDSFLMDELLTNEYAILWDENDNFIDVRFRSKDGIEKIKYHNLKTTWDGILKPRNIEQRLAFDMLGRDDIPVKILTGGFGSGKSFCMINFAFEKVLRGEFEKIVFVRNNIEVANTSPLGALPGEVGDKMQPWTMPLADHLGSPYALEMAIQKGQIEVIPLGFIRGRDIHNSIIYSMESENLTVQHMQLLLGRVAEGSQLWCDGDFKQTDKRVFDTNNGLRRIIERLTGNELFCHIKLVKTERSAVAELASLLDDVPIINS